MNITINKMFNFNTTESFAFNGCLKSRPHGHHHTLVHLLCHAFPGLYWSCFPLLLVCGGFCMKFCL